MGLDLGDLGWCENLLGSVLMLGDGTLKSGSLPALWISSSMSLNDSP